ncbi:MAG: bifunctional phosphopantothenoylcysteine decarboxylase/phosphopantothenate--cysteine ligase CoaBC [Firmicutes bacterium]|nr:bifunctional phosphopantothenoylcysteine decarboxylase/phosphopantothenate--cysteine ligase CoaBC [Bacillota bacterium]
MAHIVLGVTGSIAAFKAADLSSYLTRRGDRVDVVMTRAAISLIAPTTFQALTHRPVYSGVFEEHDPARIAHIALADDADLIVIAPASADFIARAALGTGSEMLDTVLLASHSPVLFVPAMNVHMYTHPAVQQNLSRLAQWGYQVMEPAEGNLACGYEGKGRFPEIEAIVAFIDRLLQPAPRDLEGVRLLVTAGGTREPLDPVRYLGNRSSGKMGHALAQQAVRRGALVTLVTASALPAPNGVETIRVSTAEEMASAVLSRVSSADVICAAAAVADFRVEKPHPRKIKKEGRTQWQLDLIPTTDILQQVAQQRRPDQVLVGFAAETDQVVENARKKLQEKRLDLVVANDVSQPGSGFEAENDQVWLVTREGVEALPLLPKTEVADHILDRVVQLRGQKMAESVR